MIRFDFDKMCYGCRNCEKICPKGAIQMVENDEGFLIPKVNKEKCINCGLCEKKCPHLNFKDSIDIQSTKWYAGYRKNTDELIKSTSGGIFPVLAEALSEKDNMVCACVWNDDMKAEHVLENFNIDIVNKMKQSKYVQSDLNDCIVKIKESLKAGKKVLFVGTPCQVAAVKTFCDNIDEKLYTCALICEGVASPKVWKLYKGELEKKARAKMKKAVFRNKEIGWDTPVSKYEFENGKIKKQLSFTNDLYVIGFLQGVFYRNSCMNCQYKCNGHNSDILIGDLWGVKEELQKKSNNKGISAISVNTKKGMELFNEIKEKIDYEEINYSYAVTENKRISENIKLNKNREKFFKDIDVKGINENIKENIKISKNEMFIKQVLYKLRIYGLLKKFLKKVNK